MARFLREHGWVIARQGKGSHEVWRDPAGSVIVLPRHGEVSAGLVRQIITKVDGKVPSGWR
ncbi:MULTISPECIES: type II toxin-antitoxin system HicA family toxin [unclassified Curtobacterium]|uniref:type II toxin-antitoxin system HicA family toxin n=1 Tax=unclassified Curtobacterium TaxID=257496 RepID=UPI0021AC2E4B|nr:MULTISPECIES: type II toxin-antitoxin system HicA family toxin [unclassified Curtobacterium]WIB63372.1 type II toxin-antitoxin system HicA family toxin [Curtobacterium sp. MCBD17_040]